MGAEGSAASPNGRSRRRGRRGRGRRDSSRPDGPAAVARRVFGISRLRPQQKEAIDAVLAGRDTFAVLPTGFGKSLIYQVPAIMRDRPTVVVSPLIALMADQERSLRARKVPVVRLDSTLRAAERREALARIEAGGSLVVLTTPETLGSPKAAPTFEAARPWLLCVDEAHSISEWGHDFRPAYLRLAAQRERLGNPQVLALTATARPQVREDIAARLEMVDPLVVSAPPYRPNLRFSVRPAGGSLKVAATGDVVRRLQRPGIVYSSTTVDVDRLYEALGRTRVPVQRYHGKMKPAERAEAQSRFMRPGKRTVMIATSAFGMGIDKPDIRYILHYQAPGSLEQYVQEAGRAGRDGKAARCILLFDPDDLEIQRFLLSRSRIQGHQLLRLADALIAYEDRPVGVRELALAARVPQTAVRALANQLEQAGALDVDRDGRYRRVVTADELGDHAEDLAERLEVLRREDERRLRAVAEYALGDECRSRYIRRYFGEEDPPVCGLCDRCRERVRTEAMMDELARTTRAGVEGVKARPEQPARGPDAPERQGAQGRKRSGRGRRRRRGSRGERGGTGAGSRRDGGGGRKGRGGGRRGRSGGNRD